MRHEAGKRDMGRQDTKDRPFFSDEGRFAELINRNVYRGEKILLPENLTLLRRVYPSLSGASGEKERDVVMKDRKLNICYGLEIETESDYSMPERVMVYDACEYEYQIREIHKRHMSDGDYDSYREKKSRMKEADFLLPMITTVLYLGEVHWEAHYKLSQMLWHSVEERALSVVGFQDYSFPLIEADFVKPEDYQTDLRDFFQAMQCRRDKKRLIKLLQTERFLHLDRQTEQVIAVHLNMKGLLQKMEKENKSMCKAVQDWIEDERNKGRREGIKEGKREGKKEGKKEEKLQIIRRMQEKGLEESLIRQMTKCTKAEFAAVAGR